MARQKKDQYWLCIEPYVHISSKGNSVIFYNTYSGKILEFVFRDNQDEIYKITQRLLTPVNCRVIRITNESLSNPVIKNFIELIRDTFMGDIIPGVYSDSKPIQLTANRPKIRSDIRSFLKNSEQSPGEFLKYYLSDITIYLNDRCSEGCEECSGFFKQAIWCNASRKGGYNLDISKLHTFFQDITSCNLNNITICGGNVLVYPYLKELTQLLKNVKMKTRFHLNYLYIMANIETLQNIVEVVHEVRLLVQFPLNIEQFNKSYSTLCSLGLKVEPIFFIQSEDEFATVESILSKFQIDSPIFLPYYNKNNYAFFKDNFFITKEEIETKKPNQTTVYANDSMNLDNFGKITILPNGQIHANIFESAIGVLGKDSIYDCLFKELQTGKSWFKLRKHCSPCKSCNFNQLCPPISNYNRVMKRNNLCRIWDNQ